MKGSAEENQSSCPNKFSETIAEISRKRKSPLVLALDLSHRTATDKILRDAEAILGATSDYVCAVKINYHLLLPLSIGEMVKLNQTISASGLVSIADMKLNDIDNTNRIATDYLWDAGFSAVIVNPFVGFAGALDAVFERANELGKGIITLAYMSHKGADEGYGLELADGRTVFDEFLKRANRWGSAGVILGTTRPEKIKVARSHLRKEIGIFCPGSGSQGGDARAALRSGADYLIYGRSIVESNDVRASARKILESIS